MKLNLKLGISFALLLSLTTLPIVPASAATASPKCDRVKAQVMKFEKSEKTFSTKYEPVNGKWSWFFTNAHLNEYWLLQKRIVNFEVRLFAYASSNLTCFSKNQQEYIETENQEWKDIKGYLKGQPDWVAGIAFVPIEWDSIYNR